ncbi:hypothetical protein GGX14DRAFT_675225 [Mycena pura]|uniref:Uncharacterized protein n=1 Tax=Mycena pura TaxID=153505 RepID=A0AAD6YJZ6_9AGAR|nr:hypothetical protein GGX14DRAFT_675225 [Mycena pura]
MNRERARTSSGLGSTLVKSVLARGDRVIATAHTLDSIKHFEGTEGVAIRQLDVTAGAAAISATVAEAAGIWGRLDVVVNNAGVGYAGLLEESGSDLLRKAMAVNFFGVMDVVAASLTHMRAQRSGTLVIVGSRSAWRPEVPGLGGYAASKAAVHALAETLTVEVAPFGVRVLLVEPGVFPTKISRYPVSTDNPIADYDAMRAAGIARFKSWTGTEPSDPGKAMEAVVDVVRGEGVAAGRPWPGRLALGEDCENDIRAKAKRVLDGLDAWSDVARAVKADIVVDDA